VIHTFFCFTGSHASSAAVLASPGVSPSANATPGSTSSFGEVQCTRSMPVSLNTPAISIVGMYTRPVFGLYDMACQLCAPNGLGYTSASPSS
jgi:hypothetical protein